MKRFFWAVLVCALIVAAFSVYRRHDNQTLIPGLAHNQNNVHEGTNALHTKEDERKNPAQTNSATVSFGLITSRNDYERYKEQAKHDAVVAYLLALKLTECRNLDRSYEVVSETAASNKSGVAIAAKMADASDSKYEECKNIPRDDYGEYKKLLEFAANNGVIDAQTDYSTLVANEFIGPAAIQNPKELEDYRRRSMDYLSRAAKSGSSKALLNLALAFEDGILTSKNSMAAYSYMYAYRLRSQTSNGNIDRLLNNMSLSLTTQQLMEARAAGEKIADGSI